MNAITPAGLATIDLGCLDLVCQTEKLMSSWATEFGEHAWNLLSGAFTGEASYISSGEFSVATMMTNSIAGVMAFVLIVVGSVQLIKDGFKGGIGPTMKTFFAILLAWPMTAGAVWLTMQLVRVVDDLTRAILESGSGGNAIAKLLAPSLSINPPPGQVTTYLVVIVVIWIVSLVLSLVMIIRNFMILALIAAAPMALMLFPAEVTRTWSRNWAGAVLAALLIKPAAALLIVLAAEIVSHTSGLTAQLTGLVGLIMAAISPLFAGKIFAFANLGQADAATEAVGRSSSSAANNSTRAFQSLSHSVATKSRAMNTNIQSQNSMQPNTPNAQKLAGVQSGNSAGAGAGAGAGAASGGGGVASGVAQGASKVSSGVKSAAQSLTPQADSSSQTPTEPTASTSPSGPTRASTLPIHNTSSVPGMLPATTGKLADISAPSTVAQHLPVNDPASSKEL